jgi:hypothetical protein
LPCRRLRRAGAIPGIGQSTLARDGPLYARGVLGWGAESSSVGQQSITNPQRKRRGGCGAAWAVNHEIGYVAICLAYPSVLNATSGVLGHCSTQGGAFNPYVLPSPPGPSGRDVLGLTTCCIDGESHGSNRQ